MPHPFPARLREKHNHQAILISFLLVVSSWPAFLFVFADNMPWILIPYCIVFLMIYVPFFVKRKSLLCFLLFNPLIIMILFYILLPTVRYFKGEPTLIDCGYEEYSFGQNEMLYIHFYDDDCELGGTFYLLSDDLNNAVTHFWVNLFGNPIHNNPQSSPTPQ